MVYRGRSRTFAEKLAWVQANAEAGKTVIMYGPDYVIVPRKQWDADTDRRKLELWPKLIEALQYYSENLHDKGHWARTVLAKAAEIDKGKK